VRQDRLRHSGDFDPQRFTPAAAADRHRYAYLPFGAGARACIGGHFAMLEVQIATAAVFGSLHVTAPDRDLVPDATGITLRPPRGLTVRLCPTSPDRRRQRDSAPSADR
jgi:cytochrome P450